MRLNIQIRDLHFSNTTLPPQEFHFTTTELFTEMPRVTRLATYL